MTISRITNFRRTIETAYHLRFSQIYHRIKRRILKPTLRVGPPPPCRQVNRPLIQPADRDPFMISSVSFSMLGQQGEISSSHCWNDNNRDKLWLYHCHYFEDLVARDSEVRKNWHQALMKRWIDENPPGQGNGWEPYPLSLRISHWILWHKMGNELSQAVQDSLVIQVRWLIDSIEWHILANHVVANAKALVLAGCWASGDEGNAWLGQGFKLMKAQIAEQVLADGGHIERSPMYHCQVFNDLLDIHNCLLSSGINSPAWLQQSLNKMAAWLVIMCHPDGDIALFNDSAFGMTPSPRALAEYAKRLGIRWPDSPQNGATWLEHTGYVRLQNDAAVVFCDAAPLGPDWQPGHGHADTLTWECSLFGQRVVVDSGTSTYAATKERLRQRGSPAHNTITIDGMDSSEVWGAFRVARRAHICGAEFSPNNLSFTASHDGYRRQGVLHRRNWTLHESGIDIVDYLEGNSSHAVESNLLFHPDISISGVESTHITMKHATDQSIRILVKSERSMDCITTTYHPRFGERIAAIGIKQKYRDTLPHTMKTQISWSY